MGQRLSLSCGCGYQKDVLVGEGMMARKVPKIHKVFADADLSAFERAVASGADYAMGTKIAYCADCGELVSVPVLRYAEAGETTMLIKSCPECGGEVAIRDSAGDCPKCGEPLREQHTGLWD